jgi:hypothetical protein
MSGRIRPLAAGGRVKAKPVPRMSGRTGSRRQLFEKVKLCNVLGASNTDDWRREVSLTGDGVCRRAGKLLIYMTPRCRDTPTQKPPDGRSGNATGSSGVGLCEVRPC